MEDKLIGRNELNLQSGSKNDCFFIGQHLNFSLKMHNVKYVHFWWKRGRISNWVFDFQENCTAPTLFVSFSLKNIACS